MQKIISSETEEKDLHEKEEKPLKPNLYKLPSDNLEDLVEEFLINEL